MPVSAYRVATVNPKDVKPDGSAITAGYSGSRRSVLAVAPDPDNSNTSDNPTLATYLQREYDANRRIVYKDRDILVTGDEEMAFAALAPANYSCAQANTSYPLAAEPTPVRGVLLMAHPGNVGRIWYAIANAAEKDKGGYFDTSGIRGPVILPVNDLAQVFVLAETSSDKVCYLARK